MMGPSFAGWLHGRHLCLYHPDGHPQPTRTERAVAAVYNATRLVIYVDRQFGRAAPRRYRFAHLLFWRDTAVYAVPPLHWILRVWDAIGGRWCLHRLGLRWGLLELEEGGYYRDARVRWPGGRRM